MGRVSLPIVELRGARGACGASDAAGTDSAAGTGSAAGAARALPGALPGALARRAAAALSPRAPRGRRRLTALALLIAAAAVAVAVGPGLSPDRLAEWARGAGWWLPVAFVAAHALVCIAPVPRTAFTVAAGVLFAPAWAVALSLTGTALAAAAAFHAGRTLGREAVQRRLTHPSVRRVDERLRRRGWLAVGSLRMIPVVPFSVLNYCCSVSGVRMPAYLAATVVGSLPGTVAVVFFGEAVRSGPDASALGLSAAAIALGVAGLVIDARLDAWRSRRAGVLGAAEPYRPTAPAAPAAPAPVLESRLEA